MKLRKLKCHCAAPSKGMCSPDHMFLVNLQRHVFQLQKKVLPSITPPLPSGNVAFEWLWAFWDQLWGEWIGDTLNWSSVGYIYTINSHFRSPPTHWADSPGEMTRRNKARGDTTFGACLVVPSTRSMWIMEEEGSSLTRIEPEASPWKILLNYAN